MKTLAFVAQSNSAHMIFFDITTDIIESSFGFDAMRAFETFVVAFPLVWQASGCDGSSCEDEKRPHDRDVDGSSSTPPGCRPGQHCGKLLVGPLRSCIVAWYAPVVQRARALARGKIN